MICKIHKKNFQPNICKKCFYIVEVLKRKDWLDKIEGDKE